MGVGSFLGSFLTGIANELNPQMAQALIKGTASAIKSLAASGGGALFLNNDDRGWSGPTDTSTATATTAAEAQRERDFALWSQQHLQQQQQQQQQQQLQQSSPWVRADSVQERLASRRALEWEKEQLVRAREEAKILADQKARLLRETVEYQKEARINEQKQLHLLQQQRQEQQQDALQRRRLQQLGLNRRVPLSDPVDNLLSPSSPSSSSSSLNGRGIGWPYYNTSTTHPSSPTPSLSSGPAKSRRPPGPRPPRPGSASSVGGVGEDRNSFKPTPSGRGAPKM